MATKRRIVLGTYDTAASGWTLTSCPLDPAEPKTNYIDIPGGDGSLDLTTATADGETRYSDRVLTVTLESSEGDRLAREAEIRRMTNLLHGLRVNVTLPDDEFHYLSGRVHVRKEYNNLAHAAVTVTVTCEPWKYKNTETAVTLALTSTKQTARLVNNGRRAVVPVLTVSGTNASAQLTYGTKTLTLSAGSHKWPDLLLTAGTHNLQYSGTGALKVTYREAVLE